MEAKRKKALFVGCIILSFSILGILWSFNNLNDLACNPPISQQNLTYPVQLDFGFNRINIGCNTISIGDGNFDYYNINEFAIAGIMIFGFVVVYFVFGKEGVKDGK